MLLSFYLFVILAAMMVVVSLADKHGERHAIPSPVHEKQSRLIIALWAALFAVMIGLYVVFN